MKYEVGFIGCGNMASAIISGLINKSGINPDDIIASDAMEPALSKIKQAHSINTTSDNKEVAKESHILFLAVKPQYYADVLAEIKGLITDAQIVVTIAPGKTLSWLGEGLGPVKIVRTMPNTPALVGEGITGVCKNANVSEEEFAYVMKLLESFGMAEEIPEALMDVCVSVSGSSPAYVFMFIELWLMQQLQMVCQETRPTSLLPRQFLEVPGWSSKQESIPASLRIWFVLPAEQQSKLFVYLKKKASEVQ